MAKSKNIIAIGIYRYPGGDGDNLDPYIVTNPDKHTKLTENDLIYVLSPTMPDYSVT